MVARRLIAVGLLAQRASAPANFVLRAGYRHVNLAPDLLHLRLAIEVSSHNVVCLYERVKLALEVFVLLAEESGVLLERLHLRLQVEVSIHQGLV